MTAFTAEYAGRMQMPFVIASQKSRFYSAAIQATRSVFAPLFCRAERTDILPMMLCAILCKNQAKYPDCAVTLSLGERSYESYKRLFDSGADRYLLRHETADKEHYEKLHPDNMSHQNRLDCLYNLKK